MGPCQKTSRGQWKMANPNAMYLKRAPGDGSKGIWERPLFNRQNFKEKRKHMYRRHMMNMKYGREIPRIRDI